MAHQTCMWGGFFPPCGRVQAAGACRHAGFVDTSDAHLEQARPRRIGRLPQSDEGTAHARQGPSGRHGVDLHDKGGAGERQRERGGAAAARQPRTSAWRLSCRSNALRFSLHSARSRSASGVISTPDGVTSQTRRRCRNHVRC